MAIPVVSPESTAAVADLIRLREQFVKERLIFVESSRMIPILKLLGATDEDMEKIKTVSNGLPDDPTLPFRKSKNARFCFDFEQSKVRRLEFQPFILSADEDFVRHDSGQVRRFAEVEDDLQCNSTLQALFVFKALIFHGVPFKQRPRLDYETENFVCTLFNLRTVTSPDILGEPALEGVHSDGVDFTMTTFLGSENMAGDSATTFVHDMRAKNALRWNEVNPEHTLGSHQHREFLDTLLFVDHERKHSLSPVYAIDPSRPATRDMLIFFTRKPVVEGHPSHPFDSLNSHISLPMEVGLA
ncbi:2-oxoglutarate-Fe(II)-dependent dioxygenase family protein [Trichophyton interdigitale]|uniref:2-oxoglutarate-Fe(II)-dependent dioxygenase family protein n=1 Tax=Trichophyton interdigitale TaxID=101480 RepID=A0A9P4YK05_9EURO|nr:2-oxoglutarate-Fe(II)-dependent dioxygenase family protein [Trichophyton interdigitale]KAF3898012.1 2-oxoglutarate-Fe(II)-dependent dioxygenase family protein [Trichophyton interdigitale]KAG8211498.1 2-oxoglutarate-Fe(II)-dependent dioxygenase family protein [Trichophyton interdigitale]